MQTPAMSATRRFTTDLTIIRKNPNRFTWGVPIAFHDVGPYTVVEYKPFPLARDVEQPVIFHVYIDGKDESCGAETLDRALLLAIGRRHLGPNEGAHMATAATRLFKL